MIKRRQKDDILDIDSQLDRNQSPDLLADGSSDSS
jgi:hypothetical protein